MKEIETGFNMSITEINHCLIVELAGEITDENIEQSMRNIVTNAYRAEIRGAVLNFSMISVIDSYTFDAFIKISKALLLMDVKVVWAGLKPAVICALMDLNVNFDRENVLTALNLEHALSLLADASKRVN